MMHIGPGDGKRSPLGKATGPSADQPGGKIKGKRTRPLLRLEPGTPATQFDVEVVGTVPAGLLDRVDETPVGLAVVELDDMTELVVFVSARRKRGG